MSKILVIGESCKDKFIYCETNRLCPEAPVPVVNPIKTLKNDGMSANVVENIKALYSNYDITHITQKNKITKTRYVDNKTNHLFLRVDEESEIDAIEESTIDKAFKKNYDIVIVSDYNKGFLNDEQISKIAKSSKLSILDTKRKLTKEMLDNFTFIKLNEQEYSNQGEISHYKEKLLITMGKKGTKFKNTIYPSPNPQETIDVSGAGDTFTAVFITEYCKTTNVKKAIISANKMASIVVSKRGVATP